VTITLLGTGTSQGVPVVACNCDVCISEDYRDKRLRCSVLIENQGKTFVIDTGPDFRYQMLRAQVMQLDAVLLTHQHKDHIAGLDDVRAFNFKQKNEMCVYADQNTLEQVRSEFYYAFAQKKYPGVPEIKTIEIDEHPFDIHGIKFIPVKVMHHLLPVLGFRIDNFAYITDAKTIPPHSIEKLKNLDVLVLNALRIQSHIAHFNLDEALEMVEILKPKRTYFTHISHLLGRHANISKMLPDHVQLAYDGLTLEL
jgi:phosphoribosyl 1,2-cyclic phosphate phosphodiesterase